MKILYVYDLGEDETLIGKIHEIRPNDEIIGFRITETPHQADKSLYSKYTEMDPDLVIGHGLGAFFASALGGTFKILLDNPIYPNGFLRQFLPGTTIDGVTIDDAFLKEMEEIRIFMWENVYDFETRFETVSLYTKVFASKNVLIPSLSKGLYGKKYLELSEGVEFTSMEGLAILKSEIEKDRSN